MQDATCGTIRNAENTKVQFTCSNNNMTKISAFKINSIIDYVDMSNNLISVIGIFDFMNLVYLKYLKLSDNQIYYIHNIAFVNNTFLRTLKLDGNKLRYIDISLGKLDNLIILDVTSNPIEYLHEMEFTKYLKKKGSKLEIDFNHLYCKCHNWIISRYKMKERTLKKSCRTELFVECPQPNCTIIHKIHYDICSKGNNMCIIVCIWVCMCDERCARMYEYVYVCVYACVCVCLCMYVCVCVYFQYINIYICILFICKYIHNLSKLKCNITYYHKDNHKESHKIIYY